MLIAPVEDPVLPQEIAAIGLPDFRVVDVGCSGGIAPEWARQSFATAIGFDPLIAEIERLAKIAPPNHRYHSAFIVGPEGQPCRADSWFERTSTHSAHKTMRKNYSREVFNSGNEIKYTKKKISIDEFFKDIPVHFIKTDTDGHDLSALLGAEQALKNSVGVLCEANFQAYIPNGSIWRNIDAYLTRLGFVLTSIQPVRYTRKALPGLFFSDLMANTHEGAAAWADCLYLRDSTSLRGDQLKRLAIVAEIYGLPDIAAEALLRLGEEIGKEKVSSCLDALVKYSPYPELNSYDELAALFLADPLAFTPSGYAERQYCKAIPPKHQRIEVKRATISEPVSHSGAAISLSADGTYMLETLPGAWAYSALHQIVADGPDPALKYFISLTVDVKAGRAGIGCTTRDLSSFCSLEITVDPEEGPKEVHIPVDDITAAGFLVVRNADPAGSPLKAEVSPIEVYAAPVSESAA